MYLLHVVYPSGNSKTLTFPSVSARAFALVLLGAQPVTVTTEDR